MSEPKLGTAQRYGNVTSDIIEGYKAILREIVSDFVVIDSFVYDPDMGLSPILRSEIVTKDFSKQMNGKANWLACVWGREMLKPCEEQGRLFQGVKARVPRVPEAVLYRMRLVDLTLNQVFVSPDMRVIEYLEETFLCYFPSGGFNFTVKRVTDVEITASIKKFDMTGISRLNYDNLGSLSILQATTVVDYPLTLEKGRTKLITDIGFKIFMKGEGNAYVEVE